MAQKEEGKEKLGIENIEQVLAFCLSLGIQVSDALEDGKISVGEGVSLAFKIPKGISVSKKIKPAIAEVKDLDPEEIKKLMTVIVDKLGIEVE